MFVGGFRSFHVLVTTMYDLADGFISRAPF